MNVGINVLHLVQNAPSSGENHLALIGESAIGSVNEDSAQFLFETGDVGRDIGLHSVESLGRPGERAVLRDGHQAL